MQFYTTGEIAELFGVEPWKVRRLYELGLLPDPPRAGQYRMIPEGDLPQVRAELSARGWLPAKTAGAPA